MSISSSMWIGASGLTAHGEAIETTGDNIANVNTIGFKGSRAEFEDVMGGATRNALGSSDNAGMGVRIGGVDKNMSQGSIKNTGVSTDLAIDGNGYMVFSGTVRGVTGQFYSRNGELNIAKDGTLVNQEGLKLQGHPVDAQGRLLASVTDLKVGNQTLPPKTTANVTVGANVDSGSAVPAAWDPTDPYGTSNFSTSTTVYDSLGNARKVDLFFRNTGGNNWEWHAMTDGSQVTGGTPGTYFEGGTGTLSFNTDGTLQSQTGTATSWDFLGATAGQPVQMNFGDDIASGGTGLTGMTQFAAASNLETLNQDGYASGSIQSMSIADDGVVTGSFSNGQKLTIGQVVLATFPSDEGLQRDGGQMYSESKDSGQALIGEPSSGSRGRLLAGSLEQSNVDLGQEFVDLIALQRGFQANSKIITTSDEMLQDLVALKR